MDKKEKKRLAILDVLTNSQVPLSSTRITNTLTAQGFDISERTVRLYLQEFDENGFTENWGRKGRMIKEAGVRESESSRVHERVGFLSGKIDTMAYRMDFDPITRQGTVVVNISIVPIKEFTVYRRKLIAKVFSKGYAMGRMMTLLGPGSSCFGTIIPDGNVGLGTVCSITFNGILQRRGIPVTSRFGGLLEIRKGKARRFVELISYDGTSIDPLEIFIRAGMADYIGAITSGNGLIGASFREFPGESVSIIRSVAQRLQEIGLGSLMCLGNPGQSIFDFPVSPDRAGAIIIGGLNPTSIFEETGIRVVSSAMAGIFPYDQLFSFSELDDRLQAFL
ncbi:MAG: DUF128 domain-containing protein [Deltaproteobacteria bacterium]|nr:DUF128 domain-containing protein [Deltaproteobacteria bacterium]MBN2670288.1 DUF128 domain-containing protein [Deltaproteobacteria bacterium]